MTSAPVRLADVVAALDDLYDPTAAFPWDAVGLVTGDLSQPVRRILFAVDPVQSVIDEAVGWRADLVVAHHPLLLRGVSSVAATTPKGRAVTSLVRSGVALHVAHTNADVADPGVSDALAEVLTLTDLVPLNPIEERVPVKLVTYVPRDDCERLLDALADAGAGGLGNYERCAFLSEGTGTFRPLPGASPEIGSVGEVARVEEVRVEMMVPPGRVRDVVAALAANHPYEEPAYDLLTQAGLPGSRGVGRIGCLPAAMPLREFARLVAERLPATAGGIRVAGDPEAMVQRVAVAGGSGDDLFDVVRRQGVDAYVTADLRHHPASEAREHGFPALVDCSHWATEWPWLNQAERLLAERLGAAAATVESRVSQIVTDPWGFRPDSVPPPAGSEH